MPNSGPTTAIPCGKGALLRGLPLVALLLLAPPVAAQTRGVLTVSARVLPSEPGQSGLEAARRLAGRDGSGLELRRRIETGLATATVDSLPTPRTQAPASTAAQSPSSAPAGALPAPRAALRVTIHFLRN